MNRRQFLGGTAVSLAAAASFAHAHGHHDHKGHSHAAPAAASKAYEAARKGLPTVLKQVKSVWHTASDC